MKDMQELVTAFENCRRDFRAGMGELKGSVSFCTDVCTDVKNTADEIKQLRQDMQKILKPNQELNTENERLARKREDLEQYQRLSNLEIKGVCSGANPLTAVRKIGEFVDEKN